MLGKSQEKVLTSQTTALSTHRRLHVWPNNSYDCVYTSSAGTVHEILVLYPAYVRLPARNSLVNEIEFVGPKVVMTNEIVRSVDISYCTLVS